MTYRYKKVEITPYLSDKLKIFTAAFIIIGLFIHSSGIPSSDPETLKINKLVRWLIIDLLHWHSLVPMFFSMSGFLYFNSAKSIHNIFNHMKKRVRTVLIPFIIATLVYPLCFILIELFVGDSQQINKSILNDFRTLSIWEIFVKVFYDSGNQTPYAFYLWFLRDLIIIFLLSPCLYYWRKLTNYWGLVVVFALYMIFPDYKLLHSIFWFLFGSFFLYKLDRIPKKYIYLACVLFISIGTYRYLYHTGKNAYLDFIQASFFVPIFWNLYDILIPKNFKLNSYRSLRVVTRFTFFIYLYHEPSLQAVINVFYAILGDSWFAYTVVLFLCPIIILFAAIIVAHYFKKMLPKLYSIVSGGR